MTPLIDTRPETEFLAGHAPGAACFPVEELPRRTHELPPAAEFVRAVDADRGRAARAAEFLRRRGHAVSLVPFGSLSHTERGPARVRLWRPAAFLVEAMERIR